MRRALAILASRGRELAADLLFAGGAASICYGVAQFSPGAAWIVGGAMVSVLGWRMGEG